jgi:hypothetical protein
MMAFLGGTFGNGVGTGTTRASLSAVLGNTRSSFRQIDVKAPVANVGNILLGGSAVTATAAYVELAPGESWGLNPQSFTSPAGSDFELETGSLYIVGTDVADQAFVIALA